MFYVLFFPSCHPVVCLAGHEIRSFAGIEKNPPSKKNSTPSHLFLKHSHLSSLIHSSPSGWIIWIPQKTSRTQFPGPSSSPAESVSVVWARKSSLQTSQVVLEVEPGLAANCSKSPFTIFFSWLFPSDSISKGLQLMSVIKIDHSGTPLEILGVLF